LLYGALSLGVPLLAEQFGSSEGQRSFIGSFGSFMHASALSS
jgi:hypothetical protein